MARSDEKSHGRKRPAEGDPDGAQPLTKRFGHLQIGRALRNLLVSPKLTLSYPTDNDRGPSADVWTRHNEPCRSPDYAIQADDAMLLDDTKHTTYIHNLDQELAEQDLPGEHLIILPLATRMISSVPESLLSATSHGKEIVLYSQPPPDTASDEQSTVERMIAEWRARARDRMVKNQSHYRFDDIAPPSLHGNDTLGTTPGAYSLEPMDIDSDF